MIRCVFMLCAESVIQDVNSNAPSAINILENIATETLPIIAPRFIILTMFERTPDDPNEIQYGLSLDLAGQSLLSQQLALNFQDQLLVHNTITLQGLPLTIPGRLLVSLTYDGNLLGQYPIDVHSRAVAVSSVSGAPESVGNSQ